MAEGTVSNWYGPRSPGLWNDRLDDLSDRLPPETDAEVGGDDPPSDGYRIAVESGKSGAACHGLRLLAIAAGTAAISISATGAVAMNLLPELIKSFGAENALFAIVVFVLSGWSGFAVIAYLFWKHLNTSNEEKVAILQQTNKEQRLEQKARVREAKESYRDGYMAGREHERIGANERTPPERWKKD